MPSTAFESGSEFLAKLRNLGRDHCGAVRLVRVVGEVFLVIVFGGPKLIECGHFGDDRVVIDGFGGDLGDYLGGGLPLLIRSVKDRRPV